MRLGPSVGVAAALVAVGGLAVVAMSDGKAPARASCGERGWPATVQGAPAAHTTGYRVWHGAHGWHVRLSGDPASVLAARVSADHAIRVTATSAVRAHMRVGSRSFSVRSTGSRSSMNIAFRAPCASRLTLSFDTGDAGGPATPLASQAPGVSASLPIELGAHGRAPEPSFAVRRPPTTGIAGRIIRGPTCPIVNAAPCPPAPPVAGQVSIDTAPASRADASRHVTTVTTDANGRFEAELAPGVYTLTPTVTGPGKAFTRMTTVETGVVSDVILAVGSGIYGPR